MYPLLTVDLNKIEANVKTVTGLCREYRLQVAGVTKVVRGEPAIASAMVAWRCHRTGRFPLGKPAPSGGAWR